MAAVAAYVGAVRACDVHAGLIPQSFAGLEASRIAFAHVDLDIYSAVRDCLAFVWPPSTFNAGHQHTITIHKTKSWSPVSVNLTPLFAKVTDAVVPLRVEQLRTTFIPGLGRVDQTLTPVGECDLEFVRRRL